MTDTTLAAQAALNSSARASAAALKIAVADLESPEFGPSAVKTVLAMGTVLDSAIAKLARFAGGQPQEAVAEAGPQLDLPMVQRFLRLARGELSPCPSCGGLRPSEA